MTDTKHSEEQAKSQLASIREMVAALECDYDRLEELRDERRTLADAATEATEDLAAYGTAAAEDIEAEEAVAKLDEAASAARTALQEWDAENGEELKELTDDATIDGDLMADADAARERIQEDPLSVQVRTDWYSPGEANVKPGEFEILLCTGGPACRIVGDLDDNGEPYRARIEHQDWYTPWKEYFESGAEEVLLKYARTFYFGS